MTQRPRPMGFWVHPTGGIGTPSHQWMLEVLAAQKKGIEPDDKKKLRLDAGDITKKYSTSEFPGHAAWTDGDWKLHRIAGKQADKPRFELYNLAQDRQEKQDRAAQEPERVRMMTAALENWLRSVVGSLNGEDY